MSSLEDLFEEYLLNSDSILKAYSYSKQVLWRDIFENCPRRHSRRTVDFYFPRINLIVELDGEQHFRPVAFDGNIDASLENFYSQRNRDLDLESLSTENNYTLINIPYDIKTKLKDINFINTLIERFMT